MGNTCACLNPNSEISDFWSSLALRKINAGDWRKIVKTKQDKEGDTKNIQENNFKSLIDLNLSSSEKKELAQKIFVNAMNKSEAKLTQGYLIISLLFLCQKDLPDAKAIKQVFIELSSDYGFKNYFNIDEKGAHHITKSKLYDIVSFYVDLISLFGVNIIYSGQKEVVDSLQKIYSDEIQKNYIENVLFKSYPDEFVSLDSFFSTQYPLLNNDEGIRQNLGLIHEKLDLEKKVAEAKANAEKKVNDNRKTVEEKKSEAEKNAAEIKKNLDQKVSEGEKRLSGGGNSLVDKANLIRETGKDLEKTGKNEIEKLSSVQKEIFKNKK
jgi:hypothetical protein